MSIFDYDNYKEYIKFALSSRGRKTLLASHLNCQSGFISQVLNGPANFSLEHSLAISEFLGHDQEETNFFMSLVHAERAGSFKLREYYKRKVVDIRNEMQKIKNRIRVKESLNYQDQMRYYGHWYYSAIHILTSIPQYQNKEAICHKLNLPQSLVSECLNFLLENGLIQQKNTGEYYIANTRIHLDKNSDMIAKHHCNWRIEAMKSLEKSWQDNLHYSSVISLSKSDVQKIKNILLEALEQGEKILSDSPEEEIYSLCLDFFEL